MESLPLTAQGDAHIPLLVVAQALGEALVEEAPSLLVVQDVRKLLLVVPPHPFPK